MGDPQNDWFIEKMPLKWMMTGGSPSLANHQMLVPPIPLGTEKAPEARSLWIRGRASNLT